MKRQQWMLLALPLVLGLAGGKAFSAVPKKVFQQGSRYNVNMRIGIKGNMPFSVSTVAKAGKKTSVTEISDDGQSETFVEMVPHKSVQNQKTGLLIDVTVTKKVRGNVKATEKAQIFALENQESEMRVGARGKGREDLSLAVLANPI